MLQVETKCEKRSKAVKFSKAGLRAPHDEGFSGKDEDDDALISGTVVGSTQVRHKQDPVERKVQEVTVQVPVLPVTHVTHKTKSALSDTQNSTLVRHSPDVRDCTRATVLI